MPHVRITRLYTILNFVKFLPVFDVLFNLNLLTTTAICFVLYIDCIIIKRWKRKDSNSIRMRRWRNFTWQIVFSSPWKQIQRVPFLSAGLVKKPTLVLFSADKGNFFFLWDKIIMMTIIIIIMTKKDFREKCCQAYFQYVNMSNM